MNNADSFAIVFDEIWKTDISKPENSQLDQEGKINLAFSKIGSHPFLINNPSQAKAVALFRIRLLDLK